MAHVVNVNETPLEVVMQQANTVQPLCLKHNLCVINHIRTNTKDNVGTT